MNYIRTGGTCLIHLLIACTLLLATGCRSDRAGNGATADHAEDSVADNYPGDELSVQHGMELFNRHCASCHNFLVSEIGPNLSGVTSQVTKDWLTTYIHDPKAVIDGGDERATALFERYKLYMPGFPQIQGDDMEHLLGFIHKFSEAEKRNTSSRTGGLLNPIPEPIQTSSMVLELEEWFTAPATSDNPSLARINKLEFIGAGETARVFLADQRGPLYEVLGDTTRAYLDFRELEPRFIDNPGFGTGLGNFAFHPEFAKNGLFYSTHTEPAGSAVADFALPDSIAAKLQWVLTEWKADDPESGKFSGKRKELLRADMVTQIHGFQEVTFNPLALPGTSDYGMLYLGIGDGGAGLSGAPGLCDNPGKIWGSVIRIDPAGNNSANGRYGIPSDNPYTGQDGALGEIWCRGFRNPHRITWDTGGSGSMFISNIGQHSVEEVNIGRKGADYGWPFREGTFLFDVNANTELVYTPDDPESVDSSDASGTTAIPGSTTATFTPPALQYDHDEGNAVSGGYAYRGELAGCLQGYYIFGDIPRGTLFMAPVAGMESDVPGGTGAGKPGKIERLSLELNGKPLNLADIALEARVDLRFAMDSDGELYLFTKNDGKVYRVVGCRNALQEVN